MRDSQYYTKRAAKQRPPVAPEDPAMLSYTAMGAHSGIVVNQQSFFRMTYTALEGAYEREAKTLKANGQPVPDVMEVTLDDITLRCGYVGYRGRNVFTVHQDDHEKLTQLREIRTAGKDEARIRDHKTLMSAVCQSTVAHRSGRD